jgi:hypothetical protein
VVNHTHTSKFFTATEKQYTASSFFSPSDSSHPIAMETKFTKYKDKMDLQKKKEEQQHNRAEDDAIRGQFANYFIKEKQ